jgi:predicted nucleic acid-binding protein
VAKSKQTEAAAQLLVADAGPLIALGVTQLLPLAAELYGALLVPQAVLNECTADITAPGATEVAQALASNALQIIDEAHIAPLDPAYSQGLGTGEVAVLSYARTHHHIALIDERRARVIAQRLHVPVVGSGAVLIALKTQGHIESVKPALRAWQAHGYFISAVLVEQILERAGERT